LQSFHIFCRFFPFHNAHVGRQQKKLREIVPQFPSVTLPGFSTFSPLTLRCTAPKMQWKRYKRQQGFAASIRFSFFFPRSFLQGIEELGDVVFGRIFVIVKIMKEVIRIFYYLNKWYSHVVKVFNYKY